MHFASDPPSHPIVVTVSLNNKPHTMEVDTGATLSVISDKTYHTLWPKKDAPQLLPTSSPLKMYTGQPIKVTGAIPVDVCYKEQTQPQPSRCGRLWPKLARA